MSAVMELAEKLPADSNIQTWSPPQRAIMQQLGLIDRSNWKGKQPDAPVGVIEAFLMQCSRTQLDPAARQIYAIERGGKWSVEISIDGFRLIADRTGLYRGKKPTQWCGPDGEWRDVWLSPEPPAAAKVAVMRDGFEEPLVAVATYAGYCPRDNKSGELKPSGQWTNNSSNQLAKCAEMLALRQAFPNELSGLYGTEEMQQAASPQQAAERPAVRQERPTDEPWAETVAAPVRVASKDWAAALAVASDVEQLRAVYGEVEAAAEVGLQLDPANSDSLAALVAQWKLEAPPADVKVGQLIGAVRKAMEAAPVVAEVVEDPEPALDEPAGEPVESWAVAPIPGADEAPSDENEPF